MMYSSIASQPSSVAAASSHMGPEFFLPDSEPETLDIFEFRRDLEDDEENGKRGKKSSGQSQSEAKDSDNEKEEKSAGSSFMKLKSLFGVELGKWEEKAKEATREALVYSGLSGKKSQERSYQTEFSQRITNYSSTEDMDVANKGSYNGKGGSYSMVGIYLLRKGRNGLRPRRGGR
jgi:hypothetical protein